MSDAFTRTHFQSSAPLEKQPSTIGTTSDRHLLHRRIRLLCVLGVGGWPMGYLVLFGGVDPLFRSLPLDWGCGALILVTTAAPLFYAVVLFTAKEVSEWFLWVVEYSLMGLCTLCMAWMRYTTIGTSLAAPGGLTGEVGPLYASAVNNFLMLCVIVAFGLIPHSWKRTLGIIAVITMAPIAFEGLAWYEHHPTGTIYLPSSIVVTCLTVFIGGGVTVFGSYRVERLTGQVNEAQRLLREFGQYKIIRRLGGGGMGDVHLAEHRLLKRPCAVKFIRTELAGDSRTLSRFNREVKAMTRLTHWNVVEIYDYGRMQDGTFYYVMEYVPGLNLDQLVRKHGRLPASRAIHILLQLCAGLREAHGHGLIHRDIKPSNVILGERGGIFDTVKLLDFGLVQSQVYEEEADRVTQTGAVVGTPAFMSPEQAVGSTRLTHQTDLYSLGGLGYFLLTGRPPFVRPSHVQTIHAHIADPVVSPREVCPSLPMDLEAVILNCLKKGPQDRYQDADSLEQALRTCEDCDRWTQQDARQWWKHHHVVDGETVANGAGRAGA